MLTRMLMLAMLMLKRQRPWGHFTARSCPHSMCTCSHKRRAQAVFWKTTSTQPPMSCRPHRQTVSFRSKQHFSVPTRWRLVLGIRGPVRCSR
ncbi:hypothetical protein F5B21DRAFT_12559 [Xylaria acuta]|nr:hypothetical protein F5B21DRAFT_12559 [Xylaria acuta]